MARRFTTGLSPSGFRKIARQIHDYRSDLTNKCKEFARELAQEGVAIASMHASDSGYMRHIEIDFETENKLFGCRAIVYMEDVSKIISEWQTLDGVKTAEVSPTLMLEFGAGLKAENPLGIEGGGTGTFPDSTHGGEPGWYYMDMEGKWHYSSGISANLPMYHTSVELAEIAVNIARRVFGSD